MIPQKNRKTLVSTGITTHNRGKCVSRRNSQKESLRTTTHPLRAGTYAAPTEPCEEYSWESQNDKSKTQNALMASTDDTKQFEYKDGKLSYKVSMMGTTTTMELERQ